MLLDDLGDRIRARGSTEAVAAFEASARAISNLTIPSAVVNCAVLEGPQPGFVIHVVFPSSGQELPIIELRLSPVGKLPLSVHLVAMDSGSFVELTDELAKPTSDVYAAVWDAVSRAAFMVRMLAPPEPNGEGIL